jgi:hypothetical protein
MKSPGITVRPIIGITLGHHLNEVFFEDVRVPVENRIGEENKGWTYAKFLLANERVGNVDIAKVESYLTQIRRLLEETKEGGKALAETHCTSGGWRSQSAATVKARWLTSSPLREPTAPSLMGAAAPSCAGPSLCKLSCRPGSRRLGGTAWSIRATHCMPDGTAS